MIKVEVTDTFGGAPNYSWVRRYEIPEKSNESERATVRRAKQAAGLTGRHKKSINGRGVTLHFQECIIALITWEE